MHTRINPGFFTKDVLEVAPQLLGMQIVRVWENGHITLHTITETEAYKGEDDKACHASKGRTARTEIMYCNGGCLYVYLIYGMYQMLNIVTGSINAPQAVLIRGIDGANGPGKLSRLLQINKSFNGELLNSSERIFICGTPGKAQFTTAPRIGIDYAGPHWAAMPWRFILKS